MAESNIAKATMSVYAVLEPLAPDERLKVVEAALVLLGQPMPQASSARGQPPAEGDRGEEDSSGGLPTKAARWVTQHGLTSKMLELCFHLDEEEPEVVCEVPGKSAKEKTANCYLLSGAAALLKTGEAKFNDAAARALCEHAGCFDPTNHTKYVKLGNKAAGDRKKGWKLLAPGLSDAANLVKAIASTEAD